MICNVGIALAEKYYEYSIPRWYQVMHGSIETDIKQFFEIDKITQTTGHTWRLRSIVPRLDSKFCFLFIQGHKCLESN
jgi:hypothetical protein